MSKNSEYYEECIKYSMTGWDVGWNPVTQALVHRSILKQLPVQECDILDIGCGVGELLYGMLLSGQKPNSYTGVDIVQKSLDIAERRFSELPISKEFVVAEQREFLLSAKSNSYDYAFAIGSLDIIEEQPHELYLLTILKELYRVVRKGVCIGVQSWSATKHVDGEAYQVPADLIAKLMFYFGPRIILDHSYAQHYMTVFIVKEEFPWKIMGGEHHSLPEKR